jgi:hypothetical protein
MPLTPQVLLYAIRYERRGQSNPTPAPAPAPSSARGGSAVGSLGKGAANTARAGAAAVVAAVASVAPPRPNALPELMTTLQMVYTEEKYRDVRCTA